MDHAAASPCLIDPLTLCREGGALAGEWPMSGMPRLMQGGSCTPEAVVTWEARGELRAVAGGEPEAGLVLSASASVVLECQRCLQPTEVRLEVSRRFRFARTEAEAERLDGEVEDDVLVLTRRLDLHLLLEDELILALPLVPRHEGPCPQPLALPGPGDEAGAAPPHPFAALAALRGGPH